MKKIPQKTLSFIPILAAASLFPSAGFGVTIYADNFDGGGGALDGTTPDTTPGANWVAAPLFSADGSTGDTSGSATLAFTPDSGLVYTLEASISGLGLTGGADTDWIALGFVNGQSNVGGNESRFITGNVAGTAWMMHRGDITLGTNQVFLGTGQNGAGNFGLGVGGGDNTGQQWELIPPSADIDLQIVLDTTGGPGNWNVTWYAKNSADSAYTEARATEALLPGATISAVGVARSNAGITGTLENFSLTSVPEPSSAFLVILGGLTVLRRRR